MPENFNYPRFMLFISVAADFGNWPFPEMAGRFWKFPDWPAWLAFSGIGWPIWEIPELAGPNRLIPEKASQGLAYFGKKL
jgi:hypothetical protein